MSWHADQAVLRRYAAGEIDEANAFSIEAHLLACASCRASAQTLVNPARLSLAWNSIAERIDAPRAGLVERALVRLGVREHVARLLAATPSLRLSWVAAVALGLIFAAAATHGTDGTGNGLLPFLIVAPLVPVAGVAAAYGPGADPTYEMGVAAPMRGSFLLMVRASAVVATSIVLGVVAALGLPQVGVVSVTWLLPALALTCTSLALSTWISPVRAAGAVGFVWLALVMTVERVAVAPLATFGATGQTAFAIVAAVGSAALIVRLGRFDIGRDA